MTTYPSSRSAVDLDSRLQPLATKFLELTAHIEDGVFLTQTYRNQSDQEADFLKGRDTNGNITDPRDIITNAHYGQSPHNCVDDIGQPAARAFDFAIKLGENQLDWDAEDPSWQEAIKIGESLGLVSGSTFHGLQDNPHMEMPDWQNVSVDLSQNS